MTLSFSGLGPNGVGPVQVKYVNAQQWILQSLKKIVYSVDFHIEVGLKTKLASNIF